MRYVTTRVKEDTFSPLDALGQSRGPEGGFFLPEKLPVFSETEIKALSEKSFSQACAEIVNVLFDTSLDSWAIAFAIGRYPVKLISVGNRTMIAETWHNPAWRFERLARGIEKAIRQSDQICQIPTPWLMTGSRIAVLFGIFSQLLGMGSVTTDAPIDVVVPVEDFSGAMACRYARQMGLPIHNILCCCNENAGAWNLIHKGEIRTEASLIRTQTPLCDNTVPELLEGLIFETLGMAKSLAFAEVCRRGGNFYLDPHELTLLRKGLFATVVSGSQMEHAVAALWTGSGYLADPYTALCVGGIGPYRSKSGESRMALVLSGESPRHHMNFLARCLGTTAEELKKAID